MKHHHRVTYILIGIFFFSQVIGLFIVNQYIDHQVLKSTGEVKFEELPYFERPPIDEDQSAWYIISAILIGTAILLLIIKFRKVKIWKAWYFLSVLITMTFALFGLLTPITSTNIAATISFILAFIGGIIKIYKPNVILHNITELFVYGGLAAIFVPILNLNSIVILLLLISIYDMYAVWKSKHMIKLANFTAKSNVFAGLSIPYNKSTGKVSKFKGSILSQKKTKVKTAILGGGDIGFPLLFAGVVLKDLMTSNPEFIGFLKGLIIPLFTTIALYILFLKGEKNKFYPAMPFLSAGCFLGYGVLVIFNLVF